MKEGKVELYIKDKIAKDGAIISIIVDPVDYPNPQKAVETALLAHKVGFDIIAIGGSIGAQGKLLDSVTSAVKEKVNVPIVLFPGNIATITPYADAIYFMSLLNSRNTYWLSQAQTLAAPLIKQLHIEPLPVGYIVVEPGGTVGWIGDANLVPRHKPQIAAALALAGQYSGHRIIFTDAGSAAYEPVPTDMVAAVRRAIDIPYLVAGGIKTPQQAAAIIKAGADWIQIGTAAERSKNPEKTLREFVTAIKAAGKQKLRQRA
jgi:phosphoglycerol geranylgeranyltransferase